MLAKVPTARPTWRLGRRVTLVSPLPRMILAFAMGATLAACGSATQVGSDPDGGSTVSPSDTEAGQTDSSESAPAETPAASETPSAPESLSPKQQAAVATEDLSKRTGLPAAQITVSRNDAVTWPDGSYGCPEPRMGYITMISPGRLIVLEAGGETYEYHSGGRTAPFLCEDPQPPLPGD